MSVYELLHTPTCAHTPHMCAYTYACTRVGHAHTYTHTHTHTHTYTHTHTHTHTRNTNAHTHTNTCSAPEVHLLKKNTAAAEAAAAVECSYIFASIIYISMSLRSAAKSTSRRVKTKFQFSIAGIWPCSEMRIAHSGLALSP